MAAIETNVSNGAESTLSSSLSSGATTINVTDTSAFPSVPFYAVIDPDVNASREVILVDSSKTATTFVLSAASKRGQDGTTDTAHSLGAKVVCVPVAALWTDINDRVDAVNTTATAAYTPGGTDVAVADGGTGASTATDARTNLGLGTIATQAANNVAITGGSVAGITDLAVADGGTGASTAADARTNLAVLGTADPQSASVATSESTTSTTYTDLTTSGPAVTVTIGSSGRALVTLGAAGYNDTASTFIGMSVALSGANTVAASDTNVHTHVSSVTTTGPDTSSTFMLTGLTPGSTTFTAKYRAGAGTGTWLRRRLTVVPL